LITLEELEKKNEEKFDHLMSTILDFGLILSHKQETEKLTDVEIQLLYAIDEYVDSAVEIEDFSGKL
jgi:hypothetical protein